MTGLLSLHALRFWIEAINSQHRTTVAWSRPGDWRKANLARRDFMNRAEVELTLQADANDIASKHDGA